MGLSVIDPRIFDVSGDIYQITLADDGTGTDVETAEVLYAGVRSKYMNPLKTDTLETFEFNQQTAKLKASWLIRNERSRTITPNKMIYVVDGEQHSITGVRNFKGNRNLLVLDTMLRDNATVIEVVEAPTDLVLTPNYNWINLTWTDNTSGVADSYNIYRKVDAGTLAFLANTTDLTTYNDFLVGDTVKYLEYEVEAVIGARVTSRATKVSYLSWAINSDLYLDAIDLNALILDTTDTVAVLDQSAQLAETNVYEQESSGSLDGWVATNATPTFGESIGGRDNAIKFYANGSTATHRMTLTLGFSQDALKNQYQIYIPSTNTNANGFHVKVGGSGYFSEYNSPTLDEWVDIDILQYSIGTNIIQIFQAKDGVRSFTGAASPTDDILYFRGVSLNEIQDSHFTQATAANRPVVDSATVPTQIDFTAANSEFLENNIASQVATFAAMSQGSVVYVVDGNTGTRVMLSFSETSTNDNAFWVGVFTGELAWLNIRQDSGTTQRFLSTTVVSEGDVVIWSSDSSVITCSINGIPDDVTASSGLNDGKFISYPNDLDNMALGGIIRLTNVFYDNTFKHLMIRSTPLSDAESLTYANYLIQKNESI